MKFEQFNLDSRLMVGVKKAGYEVPTPIQEAAIPAALRGRDLIGTAQTGTGKTAAFVLPILNKLLRGNRRVSRALIVTPTRELAEQIHEVIRVLAAGTGIRSTTIYGGVGPGPQVKALREGTEILVACPGRLLDLMSQRVARLDGIEVLVLDEADRMFDMGFLPDVQPHHQSRTGAAPNDAVLRHVPPGGRAAGLANAAGASAHRDGPGASGPHGVACPVSGSGAPQDPTAAGDPGAHRDGIRC